MWWRALGLAVVLFSGPAACGVFEGETPGKPAPTSVREVDDVLVIQEGDADFSRFELPEEAGECSEDGDCATAGCAGEVCTAGSNAWGLFTSCDEKHPGKEFDCGCVRTRCRWLVPAGSELFDGD